MINEIIIKNFQIHENLRIKLTPGLNVIVGDTDTGKSAIIRALNLLLRNQPRNGETVFKNKHKNKAIDLIVKTNGHVIRRHKRKYYLNNDPNPLKAFDKSIPLPIVEILPVSDINLQRQFDQHFLIFQTGGSAAKILNASTGMEDQESLMQMVKADITNHKANINRLLKNNEESLETVRRLKGVTRILMKANNVKSIQSKSDAYKNKIDQLENLINEIYQCQLNQKNNEKINELLNKVKIVENDQIKTNQLKIKTDALTDICLELENIQKVSGKTEICNKLLNSLNFVEVQLEKLSEIKRAITTIIEATKYIKELRNNIKQLEDHIFTLDVEFNEALLELGECPFCGTIFEKEGCKC